MAANNLPIVPNVVRNARAVLGAANTGRTISGITGAGTTLMSVCVAGAAGTRIDTVKIQSIAAIGTTSSANIVRLFIYAGSGNAELFDEITVTSSSPTASVAGFQTAINYTYPTQQLLLPVGSTLYATCHTYAGAQDAMLVVATGGDY
jgi:hypothetical protein